MRKIRLKLRKRLLGEGVKTPMDGINCVAEAMTTIGSGRTMPKTRFVNIIYWPIAIWGILNALTIAGGIVVHDYSVAARHKIEFASDLQGFKVATVAQTRSEKFLFRKDINIATYKDISLAYKALLKGDVDLVVYDELPILHFASNNSEVVVSGPRFDAQSYRWFLPLGSSDTKGIELAILKLKEEGTFQLLKKKWFGS